MVVVGGEGVILREGEVLDEVQKSVLVYEIGLVFINFVFCDREFVIDVLPNGIIISTLSKNQSNIRMSFSPSILCKAGFPSNRPVS